MKYTEDDLRKAYEQGAKDYCRSSKTLPEFLGYDVDEDKISFTYSFLRRKIDWEKFCD